MPEGALYWYGVNYGAFGLIDTTIFPLGGGASRSTPTHSFKSDHILTTGTTDRAAGMVFTNKVFSLGEYSTLRIIVDIGWSDWFSNIIVTATQSEQFEYISHNDKGNTYIPPIGINNLSIPIKQKGLSNFYIAMGTVHLYSNKIYAFWLE